VITCSRCGKENQDHYKFCLGCGAKLETAAATPRPDKATARPEDRAGGARVATPAPAAAPAPPENCARLPAASGTVAAPSAAPASGANPAVASRRADGAQGQAATAGVVTAPSTARAVAKAPARSTGPAPAPVVVTPSAGIPITSDPPMPGMVPPPRNDGSPAAPAPARDTVVCTKCGKTVGAAYAFCGACGQRLRPAGASAAPSPASAAIPRTMFATPAPKAAARGHLTLIRPDGTEGGVHPLHDGENLIGRGQGSLFDADPYLSPRHAEFLLDDSGLTVRDLRSLNGVFLKIGQEEKLESGDIFRIGQELLRFDLIAPAAPLEDGTEIIGTPNPGYWGRISVIVGRDVDGPAFPLFDESIVLGRERGDILFPEDGYVSGTHAQISLRDGQVFLSDLGSSNGTFFRLRGSRLVQPGNLVLMGQQLFRLAWR
jgi:pSer/pThr/pTyr-binding forkhead associated (FHA) protein